jgi:hypothetical protein
MRSSRNARGSVTPTARATRSPTARASGPITCPKPSADTRMPVLRAVDPPGTYGATRSTNGRRRNQRIWLSKSVDPAKSASAATANSCVSFTRPPSRLLVEDPLLFGHVGRERLLTPCSP